MKFAELALIEPIQKAVAAEGYETPTPIQQQAIPHVLEGRDVLGLAQTGTGKTAAFVLPILQRLQATPRTRHIRALVLTPTRELAAQIGESAQVYGKFLQLRHTVIFGGVGQKAQTDALARGVDILIATPGRLLDLMQQRFVQLDQIEVFVLDEADRMLDMGFIHDVKRVIQALPKKRQNLLFSATMPDEIKHLSAQILHNPAHVAVTPPSSVADRITQKLYMVEHGDKRRMLAHLLTDIDRALVFTRTKHGANRVAEFLTKAGVTSEAIHGNKSQTARERALANFKKGTTRALVATDIAARGIDIDELGYVVNYDLPNVPETYVHRIGRTARAGASGVAIAFCANDEREFLRDIERLTKRKIDVVTDPSFKSGPPGRAADQEPRPPRQHQGRPHGHQAPSNPSNPNQQRRRRRRGRGGPGGGMQQQEGRAPVRDGQGRTR